MAKVSLRPSGKDARLKRLQFQEMCELHGIEVLYSSVLKSVESETNDELYTYNPPVSLKILLDEYPTVRLLRSLNWYVATEELPFIADIPSLVGGEEFTIRKGDIIEVPYAGTISLKMIVSEVRLLNLESLYYKVKLVKHHGRMETRSPDTSKSSPKSNAGRFINESGRSPV